MMRFPKKPLIPYIYLIKEIFHLIRTGEIHNNFKLPASRPASGKGLLILAIRALALSFLVFFTIVYLHQGSLIYNENGVSVFNRFAGLEFVLTFAFLFSVFVVHRGISIVITNKVLVTYNAAARTFLEAVMVLTSSMLLFFLLILIPFKMIFPEVEILADKVRFNYIFMAIITLFFYYFVERERSRKRLQEEMLRAESLQKENFQAQLEALKNQMSPHFLFNSLNVLGSLISHDQKRAQLFTEKLSDVYRAFLDNSHQQLIPLQRELEICKAYIYLLETRFGEGIKFELEVSPAVEKLQLPPGSLQMLLENAIKHNGSTKKKPLVINITAQGNRLVVRNNLQPRVEKTNSTRKGLRNIKSRYRFLSDEPVVFDSTDKEFIARLPLLKIDQYEDRNN